MRKPLVIAGVLGAVALVAGVSYWAGRSSSPATAAPPPAAAKGPAPGVVVEASRVTLVRLPQALTAVGSLRSDETVVVRPEVAGRVANIGFREGEAVTKGQVL